VIEAYASHVSHSTLLACKQQSSDDMSEDSRDLGLNMDEKAGNEGNSERQQADGDLKKQLRMIRNRQSAALSRKRKADRIDNLLGRVSELEEVCVKASMTITICSAYRARPSEYFSTSVMILLDRALTHLSLSSYSAFDTALLWALSRVS